MVVSDAISSDQYYLGKTTEKLVKLVVLTGIHTYKLYLSTLAPTTKKAGFHEGRDGKKEQDIYKHMKTTGYLPIYINEQRKQGKTIISKLRQLLTDCR